MTPLCWSGLGGFHVSIMALESTTSADRPSGNPAGTALRSRLKKITTHAVVHTLDVNITYHLPGFVDQVAHCTVQAKSSLPTQ